MYNLFSQCIQSIYHKSTQWLPLKLEESVNLIVGNVSVNNNLGVLILLLERRIDGEFGGEHFCGIEGQEW